MTVAPLHTEMSRAPEGGVAEWLMTEDGIRIRAAAWAKGAAGTVLLFPGRTEYIEKYGLAVGEFAAMDLSCVIVDWRGQGLADRLIPDRAPGHVEHFTDYQHDVDAVIKFAQAKGLPEPYYLVAHSMGGCIGLRSLIEGLPVEAALFSGPMWGISLSPALRPVAWTVSTAVQPTNARHSLSPGTRAEAYVLAEEFEGNSLTHDQAMYDMMIEHVTAWPDLSLGGPTMQWLNQALHEMRTLAALPSPNVKAVTYLGTEEIIVDPRDIHDRMAKWPGGELIISDGARHEVMMEIPKLRNEFYATAKTLFSRDA